MRNLRRYKRDLGKLTKKGQELLVAVIYECVPEGTDIALMRAFKMDLSINLEEDIPSFREEYESWYTEARAVVRQLLPDRLEDFCAYYHGKEGNYVLVDYLADNMPYTELGRAASLFQQQLVIVQAASRRLESSLFDIRKLVQADLFDSELEAAEALIERGFHRAAGVIAGVVMEKHLAQVCESHTLELPQHPTIKDFNRILKENNVIEDHESRFIEYLRPMRNDCSHHSAEKVVEKCAPDLVEGVKKLVKTLPQLSIQSTPAPPPRS